MRNRLTKIAAGLAALAALALGGSAIAGAGGKDNTPPAPPATSQTQEPSSAVDGDNVQQGAPSLAGHREREGGERVRRLRAARCRAGVGVGL